MADSGSLELLQISRSSSAEVVAASLREAIVRGQLRAGQQLVEAALCAQLGVSRHPLREAFVILEGDRLVERRLHHGTSVRESGTEDVDDVYRTRTMLECAAIHAIEGSRADLSRLCDELRLEHEAAERSDWLAAGTHNMRFHREIVRLTGSARQLRMITTLLAESRLLLACIGDPQQQHEAYLPRNDEVMTLLEAARLADAEGAMRRYLADACTRVRGRYSS